MARLWGVVTICAFELKCSHYNRKTSYTDKVLAKQVVMALADESIQEIVMSKAADMSKEITLKEVVAMVEVLDVSKWSNTSLSAKGQWGWYG